MRSEFAFGYRNTILWVIIILSAITLGLGLSQYYYTRQLNRIVLQQQNNYYFIHSLNDLGQNLSEAESGQRGYLITGERAYLQPYKSALPAINSDLKKLLSSQIGTQYKPQLTNINKLVNEKIQEMDSTISAYQSKGFESAAAIVNTDSGKDLMTSIRSGINSVSSQEIHEASTQIAMVKRHAQLIALMAPFAVAINLLMILQIILLASRAIRRQKIIEGYREQFVTVAAHQLRTPATAVKQYLHLLIDGFYGKLSKEQQNIVELVAASNERGIDVANSLLSVTRVDSGEISLKEEVTNLNELLLDVIEHYSDAIKEKKNQTVVLNMNKRPLLAKVDPFYMKMVFENLIDNASKYSSKGKKIYVSLKPKDNYIYFSVRDQGIGVKKKDIPLLFRKFVRLDSAFKLNTEGSGLGLYLVKQLVSLHGGKISVDSTQDKGSTFTVKLKQETA
jgi:signal transduction histidine kinase